MAAPGPGREARRHRGAMEEAVEMAFGVAARHQPDPKARPPVAPHGHDPREALGRGIPSQMELDDGRRVHRIHLELRRVQEHRRQAEAELALERVVDSRGEETDARGDADAVRARGDHTPGLDAHAVDAEACPDLGARAERGQTELGVELRPVDHGDLLVAAVDPDGPARRRDDGARGRAIQDETVGHLEQVGDLVGDHPRAVRGRADRGMLLEDADVEALLGEKERGIEPRGSGADHRHVERAHVTPIVSPTSLSVGIDCPRPPSRGVRAPAAPPRWPARSRARADTRATARPRSPVF